MEIIHGFPCKTCTDVEYAKKNIDPAHPKEGPVGAKETNKTDGVPDQAKPGSEPAKVDPSVQFGGALQGLVAPDSTGSRQLAKQREAGAVLDVTA